MILARRPWNSPTRSARWPFAVLIALGLARAALAEDEKGLEARFRSECPAGLERLERTLDNLSCEGRRSDIPPASYPGRKAEAVFHVKGANKLSIYNYIQKESPPHLGAAMVACQTPSYFFRLSQDVPNGPYLVKVHTNDPKEMKRFETHMGLYLEDYVSAAFRLRDRSLRGLMNDPAFQVTSIAAMSEDGRSLVKIAFDSPGSAFWCESGWMVLEPALDWAVREYEVHYKLERKEDYIGKGAVEIERWPGGTIFPRRVRHIMGAKDTDNRSTYEFITKALKVGSVTDDQFRLAAFGIPELPLAAPSRSSFFSLSNWLFWSCLAGAVFSMILLRVSRRPAARRIAA